MNEAADIGGNLLAVILLWLWWVLLNMLDTTPSGGRQETERPAAGNAAPDIGDQTAGISPACREKIFRIDPSFDAGHFLRGARKAYEIILETYAAGDLDALRPLLGHKVLAAFERAIAGRVDRRETTRLTIIGMKGARIVDAEAVVAGMAVTVRFSAEIVSATHSPDGAVIEGDPEQVIETNDLWTFEPGPASAGRSWLVTATESA